MFVDNGKMGTIELWPRNDKTILGGISDVGSWDDYPCLGTRDIMV
jgi:hypothetical protein